MSVQCREVSKKEKSLTHFAPFDESSQSENSSVGSRFFKVGIFDRISSIGESDTSGIGTEFDERISEGERVSSRFRHLFSVQHQVTVCPHRTRPVVLGEESCVNVDTEGEMVGNEILARRTDIHRVEVGEFGFENVEFFLRDGSVRRVRTVGEDVFEHFVGHLFSGDSERTDDRTVDGRT